MKNALIAAILAALAVTPASAKASRSLKQAPVSLNETPAADSDFAYRGATVMGRDPDARVRFELGRDNPFY